MSKSNLTLEIEQRAIRQFSKFGVFLCPEVTFQRPWIKDKPANCSINEINFNPKYNQVEGIHIRTEILDLLESNSQKGWVCYEIKISKSDFHSKAIKSFVGNYNYYLMPEELYKKVENEIPEEIGVYCYDGKYLNLAKKAKKQKMIDGINEQLNYGMIRSLARERDEKFGKYEILYKQKLSDLRWELRKRVIELEKEEEQVCLNMSSKEKREHRNNSYKQLEIDILEDIIQKIDYF